MKMMWKRKNAQEPVEVEVLAVFNNGGSNMSACIVDARNPEYPYTVVKMSSLRPIGFEFKEKNTMKGIDVPQWRVDRAVELLTSNGVKADTARGVLDEVFKAVVNRPVVGG